MIIERSYFIGEIHIPNSQNLEPNSDVVGNGSDLDLFIEKHERSILIKCLGYGLFRKFESQLDSSKSNGLKDDTSEEWDDLLNGKDYIKNGQPCFWRGLTFNDGSLKRSLIAQYIYCEYLRKDSVHYSGTGFKQEKTKNAVSVSPDMLYVNAFREFHELTEFSCENKDVKSLYDFLSDHKENYENWKPERFENQNRLGI